MLKSSRLSPFKLAIVKTAIWCCDCVFEANKPIFKLRYLGFAHHAGAVIDPRMQGWHVARQHEVRVQREDKERE